MSYSYTGPVFVNDSTAVPLSAANLNSIRGQVETNTAEKLDLAGGTMSGLLALGTGDTLQFYNTTIRPGRRLDARIGSAASPDDGASGIGGPVIKTSRTSAHTVTQMEGLTGNPSSDGVEEMASLTGEALGTSICQVQVVGVAGLAKNSGPQGTAHSPDACGVYAVGRVTGASGGLGIGAFIVGRSESTTGGTTGAEITSRNQSGTPGVINLTGKSKFTGMWLHGSSSLRSGTGLQLGNPFGGQFQYGIHFNNQSGTNADAGTTTGPTVDGDIRTDSSAAVSLLIKGTHATSAISIGSGSGKVMIGTETEAISSALFEVWGSTSAANDPLVYLGNSTGSFDKSVELRNSVGRGKWFTVGTAGAFLTGTAAGDIGMQALSSGKMLHLGGTTKVVSVSQDNKLGFFGATPIVQPANTTDILQALIDLGLRASGGTPALALPGTLNITGLTTLGSSGLAFADGTGTSTAGHRAMTPTKSGAWVGPSGSNMTTLVMTNNVLRAVPFFVQKAMTFQNIGIDVTTAGVAASGTPVIRLGIYADDGTGYPGALITDVGTVDVTATGGKTLAYTGTLQRGTYYLVAAAQNCATTAPAVRALTPGLPGLAQAAVTDQPACYNQTSVSGALPANFTTTLSIGGGGSRVLLQIA